MDSSGDGVAPASAAGMSPADALTQAAKVGACTGLAGTAFGGVAGLTRSSTPGLFAAASGIQWFGMGTVYWGTRQAILSYHVSRAVSLRQNPQLLQPSLSQRREASTIAGGVTGLLTAAITRGRSNIIPGTAIFSLVGYLGQAAYDQLDKSQSETQASQSNETLLARIGRSPYSPVKVLTDGEYSDMLSEKQVRIEAEIALIDDEIARLKSLAQKPTDETPGR